MIPDRERAKQELKWAAGLNPGPWEEAARICISHAFMIQDISTSIGEFDVTPSDYEFMKEFISRAVYDDYDRLVQLCDSLALPDGFCPLETRFVDVTIRYGVHPYTIPRWKKVLEIKDYFEEQMGCTIYEALPCGGQLRHL